MEKLKTYIAIGVLALLGAADAAAQGTSTAVMEIRVEVVSGSGIAVDNRQFSMNNCIESNQLVARGVNEIAISIPDGAEILANFDSEIEMNNGSEKFKISSLTNKKENGSSVSYSFDLNSGEMPASGGLYSGRQIATIEYL